MKKFNILLFDGFETLDAFGPVEIIGRLKEEYKLNYYSRHGGIVTSTQGVAVATQKAEAIEAGGILLVPGGMGTRQLVCDNEFIAMLKILGEESEFVLTVCTGSALLAKTGLLKDVKATSNKRAFGWAASVDEEVNWQAKARWVEDGKYFTSSGISAGMDMALGFVARFHGEDTADKICFEIEYIWNKDKNYDPFRAGQ
ncbi:DJ-1/PfpI family protein [Tyzzerella sp. OttesenSCG-928-J15]|nr:DJ-1/PfpI family protein [Tyzzerella sp. OttesenSCG-928-J15]